MALNNNLEECSDKLRVKIEEWLKWDRVSFYIVFFFFEVPYVCRMKIRIEFDWKTH